MADGCHRLSRKSAATSRCAAARRSRRCVAVSLFAAGTGSRFGRGRASALAAAFEPLRARLGLAGGRLVGGFGGGASAGAGSATASGFGSAFLRRRGLRLRFLGRLGFGDRRLVLDRPLDHRRAVGLDRAPSPARPRRPCVRAARRLARGLAAASSACSGGSAAGGAASASGSALGGRQRLPRRAGRGRARRAAGAGGGAGAIALARTRAPVFAISRFLVILGADQRSLDLLVLVLVVLDDERSGPARARRHRPRPRAFDAPCARLRRSRRSQSRSKRRSAARCRPARRASC